MIVIVDAELDFLDHLSQRLQQLIPGINLMRCHDQAAVLQSSIGNHDDSNRLYIYNIADFPDLPALIDTTDPIVFEFWTLSLGAQRLSDHDYGRTGSIAPLVDSLRGWLNSQQDVLTAQSSVENMPQQTGELRLLFSAESNGYRPDICRQRLSSLVADYQTVIYLPLMPTYLMSCLTRPGAGVCLSDLLLRLSGEDVLAVSLGHYLQPHPDGFLQFRPPDRSDDLVLCSPGILRRLIVLLRDYVGRQLSGAAALIDCAGLPLASIAYVAVLCDSCEILLPERDCFSTDAARREVGMLLADLPASCKVIGNSDTRKGRI